MTKCLQHVKQHVWGQNLTAQDPSSGYEWVMINVIIWMIPLCLWSHSSQLQCYKGGAWQKSDACTAKYSPVICSLIWHVSLPMGHESIQQIRRHSRHCQTHLFTTNNPWLAENILILFIHECKIHLWKISPKCERFKACVCYSLPSSSLISFQICIVTTGNISSVSDHSQNLSEVVRNASLWKQQAQMVNVEESVRVFRGYRCKPHD